MRDAPASASEPAVEGVDDGGRGGRRDGVARGGARHAAEIMPALSGVARAGDTGDVPNRLLNVLKRGSFNE